MNTFARLINQILRESKTILLEMPVATQSRDKWVQGVLNRLGNEGEKGWKQAGLKLQSGVNQRDTFHGSRFVFDTFADTIQRMLVPAVRKLQISGVARDLVSLKKNIPALLQAANLDTCLHAKEIQHAIEIGLSQVPDTNNSLAISRDWFVEMFIIALTEKLFDYIFSPNTENLPVYDAYGRSEKTQGVLDFYNPAVTEKDFIEAIKQALIDGDGENPPVLNVVAQEFGFSYKKHIPDLDNISRILAQCREEIVSDFKTKHQTQYKL